MDDKEREQNLNHRLEAIHKQVEWMANAEARAVWVNGYGAKGEFLAEKERFIKENERILDELERPQAAI